MPNNRRAILFKKRWIAVLCGVALLATLVGRAVFEKRQQMVSHNEAIAIATQEAIRLGYDVNDKSVDCSVTDRVYSVRFSPRAHVFGGGMWVKINAVDGSILDVRLTQ